MDKQDELVALIHEAHRTAPYPWWHTDADKCRMAQHIAAAVRSFMGSDEAVRRVRNAVDRVMTFDVDIEKRVGEISREDRQAIARAALSASIGEDIGGGRG